MRFRGITKKIIGCFLSTALVFGIVPSVVNADEAYIKIDGDSADWEGIGAQTGGGAIKYWKSAYDDKYIYLMYERDAVTQWDNEWNDQNAKFTLKDKATGKTEIFYYTVDGVRGSNGGWDIRSDAYGTAGIYAHENNPGPLIMEMAIDRNAFNGGKDFSVFVTTASKGNFTSAEINSKDLINLAVNAPKVNKEPAIYKGISIDGDYSDWDAVEKVAISCPNPEHPNCISQLASVWDGDYLYIYVRDGSSEDYYANATLSGTHNNGKWTIKSDLGYETLMQFRMDPSSVGIDGEQVAYVGDQWEIAIPKSALPIYKESLTIGLYQSQPFIDNIININPQRAAKKAFGGIVFDGLFDDWEQHDHITIQYATAGTQEKVIDGSLALEYDSANSKIYGHVMTAMPQHLAEGGDELTHAVSFVFNSTKPAEEMYKADAMTFYLRATTVDANGNINWNPQTGYLPAGEYEFAIMDQGCWGASSNVNNILAGSGDTCYGMMKVSIGINGKDEAEFYLDADKLAQKFGVDKSDLKIVAVNFGKIGYQWYITAGTSSGPIIGVAVAGASVLAVVFVYRKRKGGRKQCSEA